jgi:hypothetical protein
MKELEVNIGADDNTTRVVLAMYSKEGFPVAGNVLRGGNYT